ncbi:tetratricopeptide repeat protein [Shivajiella indica]|uniref:Tetratricopeptide repeat protein n=1 Tax=Shivajiella indica TaxID=872115 RepID=A0ABW5B6X4_9BACT
MPAKQGDYIQQILLKGLPLMLSILGSLLLLSCFFFWSEGYLPVIPGIFSESVAVTVNFAQIATEFIPLEIDNFLIFQNYESFPPASFPWVNLIYGAIIWLLFNLGLTLISSLKKLYFIGAAALTIFLLTFSGINGLNLGGVASNYALIGMMMGTLLPVVGIAFFVPHLNLTVRFLLITLISSLTLILLVSLSDIQNPWLWMAENATFPAAIISVLFFLHIGHAVISWVTVLLIQLNKGTGIRISIHLLIVFTLYFLLVMFTLLSVMGEINLPFPTVPPMLLMLVAGTMGYKVLKLKIEQTEQAYDDPLVGKSFYWVGFAFAVFTWAKADFSGNQPLFEFFNHIFLYGQVALGLLFFLYLMSNFLDILNSGKDVEKVIFKPQFFAYFHMRIGAIMALVIVAVFADMVIGNQLGTASTNISADYYYQSNKPLEAAILYENSWLQYRRNKKAKNAAAHLRYELREPTSAMEHLVQSFDYAPTVPNILLLSSKLHQQDKIFEALFYLEKGLEIFPNNPYLLNNLALLYSKLNRPQDALATLEKLLKKDAVMLSNSLGLLVKHNIPPKSEPELLDDLPYRLNYLAYANKQGNYAPFFLNTNPLPQNYHLRTALLRNQWSNKTEGNFKEDLVLIDSLIALEQMSFEERNYKETRILRTLQDNQINETLKYLNGMAMAYPNSAGYYHSFAARILAGQLDLQKSAVDILVATERGFENFQPYHLAILYFGGKQAEAVGINRRFEASFPNWMEWEESGKLKQTDLTLFWSNVARLHQMLPEEALKILDETSTPNLKTEWALALLRFKMHGLNQEDYGKVKRVILENLSENWTSAELDNWFAFIHNLQNELDPKIAQMLQPDLGMTRNAYWAPLIWKKLQQETDELVKYEILQEAIQFNRDPKLWIFYVKQSRKVGLDSYGSNALVEMQEWLSIEQIEKLQIENL